MTQWIVRIDPSAAIANRTQLDLNAGPYAVSQDGIDWGEAQIKAFMTEQRFGESQVGYRVPNRVVTIPLGVGLEQRSTGAEELQSEEEARQKLQTKVALLQREGGVLMRQREGGEALYADIVNASLTLPDKYGETAGIEPGVALKLECLPDFYGAEIELDPIEGTGQIAGVLQKAAANAVIFGDYPARCRVILTEKGSKDQRSLLWGFRSRHYDSAAAAASFFDAKDLTPINGAVVITQGGTYSGKSVELAAPEVSTWHPMLETTILTGSKQLTHLGSYRVWARCQTASAEPRFRLAWSEDDATSPIYNPAASMVAASQWCLLDLGEIRLDTPPVGEHWWRGVIQTESGPVSHECFIDRIWLQPVDDGAGRLRATGVPTQNLLEREREPSATKELESGTAWTNKNGAVTIGERAAVTLASSTASKFLVLEGLGFAVPTGVTIRGIKVRFKLSAETKEPIYTLARLVKAGALAGTAKISHSKGLSVLGATNDLWETTWTPAQINASNFGLGLAVTNLGASTNIVEVLGGYVEMTVFYTFGTAPLTDAVLYSGKKSEIRTEGGFREDPSSSSYVGVSELTGDLPRLPPSGLEGRPVELFIKNSRGLLGNEEDAGIDKVQAILKYRPCYLGRV